MGAGGYLKGWDDVNNCWRRVLVDEDGQLKTGGSVTIDETPVDGNTDHAISSDWAYDHKEASDAHHAKTTAGELNHNDLANIGADDHHARYTDAEAIAAVGLGGSRYHSIPGCGFIGQNAYEADIDYSTTSGAVTADTDNVDLVAPVVLPDGVTVTKCIVYGNAGATGETWELRRVKLSDNSNAQMAAANIGTEDSTISNEVIDNENYAYFIITSTLDTNDTVYGARVEYEY